MCPMGKFHGLIPHVIVPLCGSLILTSEIWRQTKWRCTSHRHQCWSTRLPICEKPTKKGLLPPSKVHSYRKAFSPYFPKFGNIWRYVSTYGGVLSVFVKFSISKKIKFVKVYIFGKKKIRKMCKIENLREIIVSKLWTKNSRIRIPLTLEMLASTIRHYLFAAFFVPQASTTINARVLYIYENDM